MKIFKLGAAAVLMGALGVGGLQAQIREQQPAEFPPASYKGKQYVDSKGCVFIRAGIDGDVSWVPRVTRSRKIVCGFVPSLAPEVAAAAPEAVTPAKEPMQITLNDTAEVTVAPTPKSPAKIKPKPAAPKVMAQKAAKKVVRQKPIRQKPVAPKPVAVAPAPKPAVVTQAAAAAPVKKVRIVGACSGSPDLSQKFVLADGRTVVRCGPQIEPVAAKPAAPVAVAAVRPKVKASATARVTDTTRIAPKHVVLNRVNTRNVKVPRGYKTVWTDGRLNPKRAEQNLQGRGQMLLIWTQTLPRRLIDQSTGRDVTASVPLVYPYTSVAQQRSELGEVNIVQRDGQVLKRIVRNPAAKSTRRTPVYSTRSTPAPQPKPAVAGKQYVQVGTYRNPQNAQRAAQQIARMGLPARIGKHRKGGTTYMSVQAGPFPQLNARNAAMQRLRGAGYHDAFARN